MNQPATRTVEQTLRISARPEIVWLYWTDPQRMADWWGDTAHLDPRPGGACRVEMDGGPAMVGEFLELVPYERIVFSFGWEAADADGVPPGSTTVEVTLTREGAGTVLTLRHTGLPAAHAAEHEGGWTHFLGRLVETAGREHEANR